ncbi:Ppx/GppA phosphatase family protein [Naumannella cuiyingiana]|uniref:Exopolyphosphatase/guanosine-5'-triphosphate, 3'-diphosphate pyrophosphatase n=1 Tax=Naumannella cuiyingiana TaxID=1347891 RepID=A0A7Z0ILP6_9ACTN|nr:Ppx/GppA phosphatase family protein [Naumannella cuiyingiana]NYI71808.1 exopolyphosphatase/guanosine-5'-triphosphate,3'-diphosphate pyrophosphatase [Naumannella cuiyingiana]
MSAERVAAIDCGTNSIRLLVAEPGEDGAPVELHRQLELVRLGQGVDATGEFAPDALARTLAATGEYAEIVAGFGVPVQRTRFVATSAARDARNREEFFAGVRERLGVEAEIISGEEEARLSFAGAIAGAAQVRDPTLVADIGGGSTELVLGRAGRVEQAVSLDIGSVRLRERLMPGNPPTPDEIAAAEAEVDAQLDGADIDLGAARTWLGVAGTATSVAALAMGLGSYDRSRVHGAQISVERLHLVCREIETSTIADLIDRGPIPPRRAEVLAGGALILDRLARRVGTDTLRVSESDILDGMVAALLR